MSIESTGAYLDLISKFVKTCSTVVPAVAWLLRAMGIIRRPQAENRPELQVLPVLGFGCFGSVLGLLVTVLFCVGAFIFIGLKFAEASSYGTINFGLPEIHLPKSDLIYGGSGLVMTLLAFGVHNKAKALGFITGALCGMTFGILFLMMMAMGH